MAEEWIPEEKWKHIVRHVPIVSVDLIVLADGGVVLGSRTNKPAKDEWFVPGGRVLKDEKMTEAVHRIADRELGIEIEIHDRIGTYEHFYETADVPDTSKHYVATGFTVHPKSDDFAADDQHEDFHVFEDVPDSLHRYVRQYLKDADQINLSLTHSSSQK